MIFNFYRKKLKTFKNYNLQQFDQKDLEGENVPINIYNIGYNKRRKRKPKVKNNYCINNFLIIFIIAIFITIAIFIIIYFKIFKSIENIYSQGQSRKEVFNIYNKIKPFNKSIDLEQNENNEKNGTLDKIKENEVFNNTIQNNYNTGNNNKKIGVAFVFKVIFGNGIGRMLSLLCSELVKIDKYDIYLITGKGYRLDFKFDERVKMIRIADNKTLIENFDKTSNIKIYVLQNDLTPSSIKWYQLLNGGKRVVGIMHGVYMSSIFSNQTGVYSIWKNNQYLDAYVQVIADDYYINKRLGINNSFFIPNLFTYDSGEGIPNSNLTYNNLMIMGREFDKIKGGLYGIKAMDIIKREIPDAKLYFISANSNIDFLKNLIVELNLTNNIEVLHYTENITHYFLNSSVLLCPSLSESFPMVMNEGKAHGLPIVAFNISYSPPYQKGVIVVDIMNYTQMAEESIKLLKDYNYRKTKGLESKLSLKEFSNKETIDKWDRLLTVLLKDDPFEFKKLQDYTFDKYYDEEKARDHLESNWNMGKKYNKYFCCHDFKDMLNLDYINNIKECIDQSLCN